MKKKLYLLIVPALFMASCTGGETPSNEASSSNEVISENISINSIVTSLDEFVSEESIVISEDFSTYISEEESEEIVDSEEIISSNEVVSSEELSSEELSSEDSIESSDESCSNSSNNVTTGNIDLPWLP